MQDVLWSFTSDFWNTHVWTMAMLIMTGQVLPH